VSERTCRLNSARNRSRWPSVPACQPQPLLSLYFFERLFALFRIHGGRLAIRKLAAKLAASSSVELETHELQTSKDDYCRHPCWGRVDLLRDATRMSSLSQVRVLLGVTDTLGRSRRTLSSTHNEINRIADFLKKRFWLPR